MGVQWTTSGVAYADLSDDAGVKEIMRVWVKDCPEGDEFYRVYGGPEVAQRNIDLIRKQLNFHNYKVTLANLSHVFVSLRDSGQLKSNADHKAEVDANRPRTRDGRLMSDSQLAWREYSEFSNTHSMEQIRQRMRTDEGFANFVHKNSERERYQDGGLRVLGVNPDPPTVSEAERTRLAAFAYEFLRTPASESRRKMLPAFNPTGWKKYREDFDAACALNLI